MDGEFAVVFISFLQGASMHLSFQAFGYSEQPRQTPARSQQLSELVWREAGVGSDSSHCKSIDGIMTGNGQANLPV
jgi:hypothetical protein